MTSRPKPAGYWNRMRFKAGASSTRRQLPIVASASSAPISGCWGIRSWSRRVRLMRRWSRTGPGS